MTATSSIRQVCVFCGSNFGADPVYRAAAVELGERLAARGMDLVYGGGNVGLMGALANAVLEGGGRVIGVIPKVLRDREVAHRGLTDLQVVDTMHERKRRMYDQSDAIVALPGGVGTLDELFESITWNQLGIHRKPIGLLDIGGYFEPLVAMLDRAVEQGFIRTARSEFLLVEPRVEGLLDALAQFEISRMPAWSRPASVDEIDGP